MHFTTSRPGKKDVSFKFAWKKRPVNADETDWPTDQMGFVATRPDGKRTAFRFTRKTRPVPARELVSVSGDARPGLGQAEMEFVATRGDGKEFRFTWNKVPLPARPPARRK